MDWYKLNSILRIVMIIILLVIAAMIAYYRFGTPPNLEDIELRRELQNGDSIKLIDCRGALIYYAQKEMNTLTPEEAEKLRNKYNISLINFSSYAS